MIHFSKFLSSGVSSQAVYNSISYYISEKIFNENKYPMYGQRKITLSSEYKYYNSKKIIVKIFKSLNIDRKCVIQASYRNTSSYVYMSDNTCFFFNCSYLDNYISIKFTTDSTANFNKIADCIKAHDFDVNTLPRSPVNILQSGDCGLSLTELWLDDMILLERNYSEKSIKEYNYICNSFRDNKLFPGRLSILNGPPGTGKTCMVRGLLTEFKRKMQFIIIPPDLISSLQGPQLMSLFLENKNTAMPIVLILEDSDHSLLHRMADNMAGISSILNLGDGIIGSTLDIRILATCNSNLGDIDPALLRPGRLCKNIHLGPLQAEHATALSKELGFNKEFSQPATLAEVYNNIEPVNPYDLKKFVL